MILRTILTEKDDANYTLKVKKKVYELKETMLQPRSEDVKSDFKGPRDPSTEPLAS